MPQAVKPCSYGVWTYYTLPTLLQGNQLVNFTSNFLSYWSPVTTGPGCPAIGYSVLVRYTPPTLLRGDWLVCSTS